MADTTDDDLWDEDDDRTLVQWLFDMVAMPAAMLALISVLFAVASGALWASLFIWDHIAARF